MKTFWVVLEDQFTDEPVIVTVDAESWHAAYEWAHDYDARGDWTCMHIMEKQPKMFDLKEFEKWAVMRPNQHRQYQVTWNPIVSRTPGDSAR